MAVLVYKGSLTLCFLKISFGIFNCKDFVGNKSCKIEVG